MSATPFASAHALRVADRAVGGQAMLRVAKPC
jgi:hypothetical protein